MRTIILAVFFLLAGCATQPSPYQDIVDAYNARLAVLTEAVNAGRMTPTEAKAVAAEAKAAANTQMQQRRTSESQQRTNVIGVMPTVCSGQGVTAVCF